MPDKPMIVEWNTHLFSANHERFPWHPQAVYRPLRELPMDPLVDYLASMDERGVDKAVVVQPEPYGDDHAVVLDAVSREPERIKCTSLFYPKDPEAVRKLEALVERVPAIVATRFHAHRGKTMYLESFDAPYVRALWQRAGELGLVIELHIGPSYALQVANAVAAMPEYPVLIDHLCEPGSGRGDEYDDVLELAKFKNVTMKLSGLDHFSEPPYDSARDLVRSVGDAYGPNQLAWSKGNPAIVDDFFPDWSDEDRVKVKGGNLARLAGFV